MSAQAGGEGERDWLLARGVGGGSLLVLLLRGLPVTAGVSGQYRPCPKKQSRLSPHPFWGHGVKAGLLGGSFPRLDFRVFERVGQLVRQHFPICRNPSLLSHPHCPACIAPPHPHHQPPHLPSLGPGAPEVRPPGGRNLLLGEGLYLEDLQIADQNKNKNT